MGSRRGAYRDAQDKIKKCTGHLKTGGRLSDFARNKTCDLATSFVSVAKTCPRTDNNFTTQDCVSYVYCKTLERISSAEARQKEKDDQKHNGGSGGLSMPHEMLFDLHKRYSFSDKACWAQYDQ